MAAEGCVQNIYFPAHSRCAAPAVMFRWLSRGSGQRAISATTFEGERLKIHMSSDAAAYGPDTEVVCNGHTVEKEPRRVVVKVLGILERDQKELPFQRLRNANQVARGYPSILSFFGATKIGGRRALVSLYMSNGNLLEYIKAGEGRDKKQLIVQVAEAVDYLHNAAGCVHGNIKCANVLISDGGRALLADFGLSTLVDAHPSPMARHDRSLRFAAPELFGLAGSPQRQTFETDIYAFGMLILEVVTENPPWPGLSDSEVTQRICSGMSPDRPIVGAFVSTSHLLWDLCRACWRTDPAERPTIKTILERLTDVNLEPVRIIHEHRSPAVSVAYTPGARHIVSGSLDGSIWIWDSRTGRKVVGPMRGQDGGTHVAVSPDGRQILSAGGRTIRRWDAESGAPIGAAADCMSGAALCIACSPDGARIAFGETDGPLRVWDAAISPGALHALEYTVWSPCVAFSPDAESFAFAAPDGAVRICDSATCAVQASFGDDGAQVQTVSFSPDGAHIVLGSDDHALRIYHAGTQQLEHILRGHSDMVLSVAYSPSGRQIASASSDGTVRIWDAESGRTIGAPLDGHQELITRSAFGEREVIRSQEWIHSVSWSPDGRSLASAPHGFNLQEIRIWDLFD